MNSVAAFFLRIHERLCAWAADLDAEKAWAEKDNDRFDDWADVLHFWNTGRRA